ncbi:MAG TPA: aspartate dehydrogenase [Beijerinckiaceae bacterium]|jgi:aspartate dehydrogenase|nr:aspartate dehydrogenase [Beijerinckiaceae bacterium]
MMTRDNDGSGVASTPHAGSRALGRTAPSLSTANDRNNDLRIAIAGYGAIGQSLAASLKAGIPGIALTAIASRDAQRLRAALPSDTGLRVVPVAELCDHADVIIECAPAAALSSIAVPALEAGRSLIVLSCGALLDNEHLVELAKAKGGRILVPTGALLGLDAVLAAAEGKITSVTMTTRKPPGGLAGAPFLVKRNIDVAAIKEPTLVFEGSAREAARGFPANVNVAVALSLAGIGPDRTRIAIWADPTVRRNTHFIEVESDAASFSMKIEGVPSANPRTGRMTAQSVVALLRKLRAPLAIGT